MFSKLSHDQSSAPIRDENHICVGMLKLAITVCVCKFCRILAGFAKELFFNEIYFQ